MGAELDLKEMNEKDGLYLNYKLQSVNLNVGNELSDFQKIGPPVGEGAFGKVWKVKSKKNGQIYALKEITNDTEKLESEITILNLIEQHPKLVRYYKHFKEKGVLYIVMEFLQGITLDKLIENFKTNNMRINEKKLLEMMFEIMSGLMYLHEIKEIAHRDLKPDNIFVDNEGHIKITDFGLSGSFSIKAPEQVKINGTCCGALPFMAPEMHNFDYKGPEIDIYMVGITLYQLMTLTLPYDVIDSEKTETGYEVKKKANLKIPDIYDKRVQDIIFSMIDLDSKNRPSARDILIKIIKIYVIKYFQSGSLNASLLLISKCRELNRQLNKPLNENKLKNNLDSKPLTKSFVTLLNYLKANDGINSTEQYFKNLITFKKELSVINPTISPTEEIDLYDIFQTLLESLHNENKDMSSCDKNFNEDSINNINKRNQQDVLNYYIKKFINMGNSSFNSIFYFFVKEKIGCKCGFVREYMFHVDPFMKINIQNAYNLYKKIDLTLKDCFNSFGHLYSVPSQQWQCQNCKQTNSSEDHIFSIFSGPKSFIIYFDSKGCEADVHIKLEEKLDTSQIFYCKSEHNIFHYKVSAVILKRKVKDNQQFLTVMKGNLNDDKYYMNDEVEFMPIKFEDIEKKGSILMVLYDADEEYYRKGNK